MADNKQAGLAVGSGPTFATDEIAGIDYPRAKIVWGVDGIATDVSAAAPLPVVQTGTPALPTGAATEATLAAASAKLPAALGQQAMAASMAVVIASNQSAVPVSGTVTITPSGTQTVTGAKTNNNAAPGATNIGALVAVANAAAPTQVEGNIVALRTNLAGDVAITLDSEAVVLGAGAATIGSLAANQSVNQAQVAGTAVDTNSGNKSAGTQRIVIATDQPNLTTPLNENVAQINGVAPLMGNGVTGTGSQRVTIASDNTAFAVNASGTKTNNNAAPGATNMGTLPALANAATPAWTEGNQVALSVDLAGALRAQLKQKATYAACTTAKTATTAGTGPWFSISGSSTKTIRIQKFRATFTVATGAVYADLVLKKTSAATSAGTATALTKVPHDSNSAASTVNACNFYTVLATAGTLVGVVDGFMAFAPLTGTVATFDQPITLEWTAKTESEAIVLRGTAQCLEASFGTTTTNAPTIHMQIVWTEE